MTDAVALATYAETVEFEWDAGKASINQKKHGVSFDEAATAFGDPLSLTIPDPDHSDDESRYILIGESYHGRLIVVVHSERGPAIRVISARQATRSERHSYEEND